MTHGRSTVRWSLLLGVLLAGGALAATTTPSTVEQPGTQPLEVGALDSPTWCENCHGNYDRSVEPGFHWRGSLMANATRDPIFWASMAIAEQDFDGAGDLCLRCHTTRGWFGGRSEPTDGSGLAATDADGVDCDTCHTMTNTDDTEHLGEMDGVYVANDGGSPTEGWYGSGMLSLWDGSEKLGPYATVADWHAYDQSLFHRSRDFCGSCHDVSNPVVGDLAPNSGRQDGVGLGSEDPTSDLADKAAFNFAPYAYGFVERTYSEFKSGLVSQTLVSDYPTLPADLQAGALAAAYESALVAGNGGDYEDGTARTFTCQTCHLRPVQGAGAKQRAAPNRKDLPLHDMTGGNHWIADLIRYQDRNGQLRLGGGLTALQVEALEAAQVRARKQLSSAAALIVAGDTLRVVNLTGHKLISGYPEGRRMWLHVTWYDDDGAVLREDGAYGPVATTIDPATGQAVQVESILDLEDPHTRIYEAEPGITQAWAARLVDEYGYPSDLVLGYDRETGAAGTTLGELADAPSGTCEKTFHFVLNDCMVGDNRIPPYGFDRDEATVRNVLPVPATLYLGAGDAATYDYWDDLALDPPSGAVYATIDLLYQGTSWEYVQFLHLANDGSSDFLGDEGWKFLEAWIHTGMCEPYVMASTTWGEEPEEPSEPVPPPADTISVPTLATWAVHPRWGFLRPQTVFRTVDRVGLVASVADEHGTALSGAQVFVAIDDGAQVVASVQGFSDDAGRVEMVWSPGRWQPRGSYTAQVVNVIKSGFQWDGTATSTSFVLR